MRGSAWGEAKSAASQCVTICASWLAASASSAATASIAAGASDGVVDARGIGAEDRLDRAQRLDEAAPVGRKQQAQAADAVADRHLVAGLLLVFRLHQLLDGEPCFGEALLEPGHGQRERGALALE